MMHTPKFPEAEAAQPRPELVFHPLVDTPEAETRQGLAR